MKPTEMDSLLLPYFQAADGEEAQRLVAELMAEQAEPLIKSIVSRKLGFSSGGRQNEGADVRSEIVLQLLHRLHILRSNPTGIPIANFRAYVVVTSYRGCAAYLRQRYPQRWHLANRLQYLLSSQPQFSLWQNENEEWVGGLAGWADKLLPQHLLSPDRIHQVLDGALPAQLLGIPDATLRRVSAAEQMAALLTWAEAFILLDDLVTVFAHWWGAKDHASPMDGIAENLDTGTDLETQIEQRIYLQKLWLEIKALPVRQRQALLLNLRSGYTHSALALLPALQIASLRQIAAAMEMSAEELAGIWNQLPLDDARIAAQIHVTRRQVINLRLSARERLLRKTQHW